MIAATLSRTLLRRAAVSRAPLTAARSASVRPAVLPRFAPIRPFSSTPLARGQGETDADLSAKLAQELEYEQENSNLFTGDSPTAEPAFVTEFKQSGIWKITDKPNVDEVTLSRDFGNEHIAVMFSVGELDTTGSLPDEDPDSPEAAAPAEEDDNMPQFPVRISATITKPTTNEGALMLDGFVQDGEVTLDNIAYYPERDTATTMDANMDYARRAAYLGPQVETLDDALQVQFREYFAERGIDANFALFVPNYAEYKEQREYVAWLKNVRKFVEA